MGVGVPGWMVPSMKRAPKVSAKQLALQGVDLRMTHPQLERLPTRRPQAGEKRPRYARTSLPGPIVPVPADDRGEELVLGPLQVFQTTTGRYLLADRRRKLGDWEIFTGTKRACVVEMVRLATK